MALDSAWNMYIFRDGKRRVPGANLVRELSAELLQLDAGSSDYQTRLMDALLRSGELECALQDVDSPSAPILAGSTDKLASALVREEPVDPAELARCVSRIASPESVDVTTPEGFAYYALHPLDYVDVLREVQINSNCVAVVGIRSIGTTLSAVVLNAIRSEGRHAERMTVRPLGHPYDRKLRFDKVQAQWVNQMLRNDAEFLVVDEGPGMSGSSFLSVGDALVDAGVNRERIAFLCSRQADPCSLTACDAAIRWPSFRSYCTRPTRHLPKGPKEYVAGGIWRGFVFDDEERWPASWLQMERLKFLSGDRRLLYRFDGLGRFGKQVHDRAMMVADAGFGSMPLGRGEGFTIYKMLGGEYCHDSHSCGGMLERLAEYCAFRSQVFPVGSADAIELEKMLRFNVREEFGLELSLEQSCLEVKVPVICDGRMLPHKWIRSGKELLKVDSVTHGDDHFFPGPTDIAWDLAGTIVEWNLTSEQKSSLLTRYHSLTGDCVKQRIMPYLLAYTVFRMAYSKMAAASMRGSEEEVRLIRDFRRYRDLTQSYMKRSFPAAASVG